MGEEYTIEKGALMLISTDEYKSLVRTKTEFEMLLSLFFNSAELSYSGESLHFRNVDEIMNAYDPSKCESIFRVLKAQKNMEEASR